MVFRDSKFFQFRLFSELIFILFSSEVGIIVPAIITCRHNTPILAFIASICDCGLSEHNNFFSINKIFLKWETQESNLPNKGYEPSDLSRSTSFRQCFYTFEMLLSFVWYIVVLFFYFLNSFFKNFFRLLKIYFFTISFKKLAVARANLYQLI